MYKVRVGLGEEDGDQIIVVQVPFVHEGQENLAGASVRIKPNYTIQQVASELERLAIALRNISETKKA